VKVEKGTKFHEVRAKCVIYSTTDSKEPIAGGKVTVYLPELPKE
jgi:hypothetical protein